MKFYLSVIITIMSQLFQLHNLQTVHTHYLEFQVSYMLANVAFMYHFQLYVTLSYALLRILIIS